MYESVVKVILRLIDDQNTALKPEQKEQEGRRVLTRGQTFEGLVLILYPQVQVKSILWGQGFKVEEPGVVDGQSPDQTIGDFRFEAEARLDFLASCPYRFGEGDAIRCLGSDEQFDRLLGQVRSL